jgi:hypothetical protein
MRRSQDRGIQRAGLHRQIVDELSPPSQQWRVFNTEHTLTDIAFAGLGLHGQTMVGGLPFLYSMYQSSPHLRKPQLPQGLERRLDSGLTPASSYGIYYYTRCIKLATKDFQRWIG